MSIYHRDIQELRLRAGANVNADLGAAKAIAAKTVSDQEDMAAVQAALEQSAQAYVAGDIAECAKALCDAYDHEVDHGDAPATNYLAQGLLERVEEVEEA